MKLSQKEFDRLRRDIEAEELLNEYGTPILYGVERAVFEQQKYKRLIAVARRYQIPSARKQQRQWMKQLECARKAEARFQKLRTDIRSNRPDFLRSLANSAL
jgi:hypothetical protein